MSSPASGNPSCANGAKVESPGQRRGLREEGIRAEGPRAIAGLQPCRVTLRNARPLAWAVNLGAVGAMLVAGSVFAAPAPVDFAAKIAPIFEEHCVDCHATDDPDGEFSLETFETL